MIRCDQPRSMDLHARKGRRLERVPAEVVDEVLSRVATLFQ
jgi:mRNA interferase ChpB